MQRRNITKNTDILKVLLLELAVEVEALVILQTQVAQAVLVHLAVAGQAEALTVAVPLEVGNFSKKLSVILQRALFFCSRCNIIVVGKEDIYCGIV